VPRWPRSPFGRRAPSASDDHRPLSSYLAHGEFIYEPRKVIELFEAGRHHEAVKRVRPLEQAAHHDANFMLLA
jgi:hypothetical protein